MVQYLFEYRKQAGGDVVAFRVQKKHKGRIYDQKYFYFSEHGGQQKALTAAKKYLRAKMPEYNGLHEKIFNPNGTIKGFRLTKIIRDRFTEPKPHFIVDATENGRKLRRHISLVKHEWAAAFDEIVKALLQFRGVKITPELAKKITRAKPLYNPTRKSNWTR